MMEPTAYFVVGLVAVGMGMSFFVADPHSPTSRPLSLFWVVIGCTFALNPILVGTQWIWVFSIAETLLFVTGLEWGLRIVRTQASMRELPSGVRTRTAQAFAILYGALGIAFPRLEMAHWKVIWSFESLLDPYFYVFAVPFFTALFVPIRPFLRARGGEFDPAELKRLLAFFTATPFWIAGMIAPLRWKPIGFALGEVVFLLGAIRYHVLQGQQGQFLARFVSPEVVRVVRERGLASTLQRVRIELSVVACDLRGFTAFAETGAPEEVMKLLEEYYSAAGGAVAQLGGTIKDFAGDGILALVGAPIQVADHARRAIEMALAVRDRGDEVLVRWRRLGLDVGLGVGAASGFATVGAIGAAGRLEYGAVGPVVNLASRLASHARASEVLVEPRVAGLAGEGPFRFEKLEPAELKGFARPVMIYAVARVDAHGSVEAARR
jgi:adenylate cyclase